MNCIFYDLKNIMQIVFGYLDNIRESSQNTFLNPIFFSKPQKLLKLAFSAVFCDIMSYKVEQDVLNLKNIIHAVFSDLENITKQ